MKIKIEAYLSAPGLLHWYGTAPNPFIFTGFFEKTISEKEKAELKYRGLITRNGISLKIRRINKKEVYVCDGQLPSISVHFFKKLKRAGWKIDKKAAKLYGFPNDEQDKKLKEDIKHHQEEAERYVRAKKHLGKTFKKMSLKF